MNLKLRLVRLESITPPSRPLTEEEQLRLNELTAMDPDHPDYELLEYLELYYKANPGLTYEQMLREAEDEW